jgi:hypothetical protein
MKQWLDRTGRRVIPLLALALVGGSLGAGAWAALEPPGPPASIQRNGDVPEGRDLARDLSNAAGEGDWEAIDRELGEVERQLDSSPPPPRGIEIRREWRVERRADRRQRWAERWADRGDRAGRRWDELGERLGERIGERGEAWGEAWGERGERIGEYWGRVGERMGEHWGEFGNRTGERWGAFGERAGRRWSRVADGRTAGPTAAGGDLTEAVELSVETVLDALETLIDSLEY